jgi:hypothetical protein
MRLIAEEADPLLPSGKRRKLSNTFLKFPTLVFANLLLPVLNFQAISEVEDANRANKKVSLDLVYVQLLQ